MKKKNSTLKLHIGCFDVPLDGWYNTDVTPHIFIARIPLFPVLFHSIGFIDDAGYEKHRRRLFRKVHYLNASKKFPLQDDSVEAIYSSQMLVNLTQHRASFCLSECYRVLKPGGIFRIAVADLNHWIAAYDPNNPDIFLRQIFQPEIRGEKNRIHWMYTPQSLRKILHEAGFSNILLRDRYQGNCPDVQKIDYRSDAMFMEGGK